MRAAHAEAITNEEGLDILAEAKEAGLAQTADNVQEHVTYMCNCCGDCCGMMQSIRRYGISGAIVSSNWVAHVDLEKCRGCKKCARACPAEAVTMVDNEGQGLRKYCIPQEGRGQPRCRALHRGRASLYGPSRSEPLDHRR